VGWDLAHAVGNVPLSLHAWNVDFAVWCSYKYLNSGPGGIAGLFVHNKYDDKLRTDYAGWWGHDRTTRFDMPRTFTSIPGAQGFQQGNPDILSVASLLGSLQTIHDAGGVTELRKYSEKLTQDLWDGLAASKYYIPVEQATKSDKQGFTIITPTESTSRGVQLSLLFLPPASGFMQNVFDGLKSYGVIGDERKPDVVRLAPAPLYNNEDDVRMAVQSLERVLSGILTSCNPST
jgi:kynureninase